MDATSEVHTRKHESDWIDNIPSPRPHPAVVDGPTMHATPCLSTKLLAKAAHAWPHS